MSSKPKTASGRVTKRRADLLAEATAAGREMSAAAALFHTAAAGRQRLSETEEKALDLLERAGALTPKEIAELCHLAPATVTGLVDRLASKGCVRRVPHPVDGRRVLVEVDPAWLSDLWPQYAEFSRSMEELYGEYSDDHLALLAGFLTEASRRQRDAAERFG